MAQASYKKTVMMQIDDLGREGYITVTNAPTTSGDITITLTPYGEADEEFTVSVQDTDSESDVAGKIVTEIDGDANWNASSEEEEVSIEHADGDKFSIAYEDIGETGTEVDIDYEWRELPANEATLNFNTDILDDTILGDDMRSRLPGLIEWDVSMTVLYDQEDEIVGDLRDAFVDRNEVNIRYLPNGESGWEGPTVIETFDLSGGVDDLETIDVNLLSAGELEDYS